MRYTQSNELEKSEIMERKSMSEYHIRTKGGSLCFYGNWFGRPFDNFHRIKKAILNNKVLFIYFCEGELLTIEKPRGITNEEHAFIIQSASAVTWEYTPCGSIQIDRKQHRYIKCDNGEIIKYIDGYQTGISCDNQDAVQCL